MRYFQTICPPIKRKFSGKNIFTCIKVEALELLEDRDTSVFPLNTIRRFFTDWVELGIT